jgi:hypothetical protein
MIAPVPRPVRRRGWLALAVSLALHAGLVLILTRFPGRTAPAPAAGTGPVALHLIAEEDEHEPSTFLVSDPGQGTAKTAQAARSAEAGPAPEVGVHQGDENIIPVTHQVQQAAVPGGVHPDLLAPPTGQGSGAGGGTAGFFAVGTQARSVVYVIDRSASMGPGGLLKAAVRELCASLARLPAGTRFQVVLYHDQAELLVRDRTQLVPASPETIERAARLLEAVRAEGGTNHLQALRLALSLTPEVVYLLTDADDLSHADRAVVTRLNRGRAVIHTIELNTSNRDRTDMPLQVLARENRGRYQAVDLRR